MGNTNLRCLKDLSAICQVDRDGCGLTGCGWGRDIGYTPLTPLELTHLDRHHTDGLLGLVGDSLGCRLADGVGGLSGGLGCRGYPVGGLCGHPCLGQVLGVDGDHHLLAAGALGNTEAFQQVVVRRYNVV